MAGARPNRGMLLLGVFIAAIGILALQGRFGSLGFLLAVEGRNPFSAIPDGMAPLGVLVLVVAVVVIGRGVRSAPASFVEFAEAVPLSSVPPVKPWRSRVGSYSFVVAAVSYGGLIAPLSLGVYSHTLIPLLVLSLIGFFVSLPSAEGREHEVFRVRRADLMVLAVVPWLLLARYWGDLTSWYFSFVGDEVSFFTIAKSLLDHPVRGVFEYRGVYEKFPIADSYLMSLFLWLFGATISGWKAGSVLVLGLVCAAVYLCGASVFNRRVGLFAMLIMGASHYAGAFALIGYNNLHMCFTSTVMMTLFVIGYRNRSSRVAFACGAVGGLMTYSIWGGLIVLPIVGLLIVLLCWARSGVGEVVRFGALVGSGFLVAALPGLLVNSHRDIVAVGLGLNHGTGPFVAESLLHEPLDRWSALITSIVAFFRNDWWGSHYVFGPLLDPVSALLVVVGFGVMCAFPRAWRSGVMCVWIALGLIGVVGLSRLNTPYLTRLVLLLPPLAIVGGVGMMSIVELITARAGRVVIYVQVIALVTVLNLQQLYVGSPLRSPIGRLRAMVREVQYAPSGSVVVVSPGHQAELNIGWLMAQYAPSTKRTVVVTETRFREALQAGRMSGIASPEATVIAPALAGEVLHEAAKRYFVPSAVWDIESDPRGDDLVIINGDMRGGITSEIRPLPRWLRALIGAV